MRGAYSACTLVAAAAGCLIDSPAAVAERGVAIDIGRIAVAQKLSPGASYRLPTIEVSNPGTEPTTYRLVLSYFEDQRARRPPQRWIRFSRSRLTLAPGEARPVELRVALPSGAKSGDYEALVGAQIVADNGGAQVGAGAASRLTFTVASNGLLETWWLRLETLVTAGPWSYLAATLAFLGLGFWRFRRRFTIDVRRRARSAVTRP